MRDLAAWFDRYAELLGCDPDPYTIAARIGELNDVRDRALATIAKLRAALAAAGVRPSEDEAQGRT